MHLSYWTITTRGVSAAVACKAHGGVEMYTHESRTFLHFQVYILSSGAIMTRGPLIYLPFI
jgi:hypothetical protein